MPVNLGKPQRWKLTSSSRSICTNDWFLKFAHAFPTTRVQTTKDVEPVLQHNEHTALLMRKHREILQTLRISTCSPRAVDRRPHGGGRHSCDADSARVISKNAVSGRLWIRHKTRCQTV